MRLIDADELIKNILSETIMNKKDEKIMDRYLYVIQNEPTAYNIDKVIEQLTEYKRYAIRNSVMGIDVAIRMLEIVKAGGVDENE